MLFRINPQSGVPIYLQLIEQVRHGVETGALQAGDQLPGLRKVAEDLVINPNTVAKAYREMEHAGLISLRHGAGAFIAELPAALFQRDMQKARIVLQKAIVAARGMGLDEGEIRRLVDAELAETANPIKGSGV